MAAKKSPVVTKKPVYKRTTIVDETSLLGVTAVLGGGGASLRTRDQGLGQGQGGLTPTFDTQANFFLLHFLLHFYNCGYETRIQGNHYNYEFYGQPSLGRTSFQDNYCDLICHVRQDCVIGGRECRDFSPALIRFYSRHLSVHSAVYFLVSNPRAQL